MVMDRVRNGEIVHSEPLKISTVFYEPGNSFRRNENLAPAEWTQNEVFIFSLIIH